jgi:hypothetical protein
MLHALFVVVVLEAGPPKPPEKPILRVYQVAGLIAAPGGEKELLRMVRCQIEPKSWGRAGPGSIEFHPLTLSIIVTHRPSVQRRIGLLLEAARREVRRRR